MSQTIVPLATPGTRRDLGRAEAGWEPARQAAGPPGFRALAATACALTRAHSEPRAESRLILTAATGPARARQAQARP